MKGGASSYPMVSIVILNYNDRSYLERCLQSVLKTDYPNFEVIFVDNASVDGSVELVEERFGFNPNLDIIRNHRNLGFAEGNNIGAKRAKGKYVVFLNSDVEVASDWLKEIVDVMEKAPDVGACQSKLLLMEDHKSLDFAGGFIDVFGFPYGRGECEKDDGQYDRVEEIFIAKGAALTVRRDVLNKVGFFDTRFFILYEDIDICWRIWLSGYKVVFVPSSIVYHAARSFPKSPLPLKIFHNAKNHLAMVIKNYSFSNMLKYLPIIILIRCSKSLLLLVKYNHYQLAIAEIKALFWNLANLKYLLTERRKVQRLIRRVPDSYLTKFIKKRNPRILYRHFVRSYST